MLKYFIQLKIKIILSFIFLMYQYPSESSNYGLNAIYISLQFTTKNRRGSYGPDK